MDAMWMKPFWGDDPDDDVGSEPKGGGMDGLGTDNDDQDSD